jgi:hypothetical protein
MPSDTRIDAYIARQADFARPVLIELRAAVHAAAIGADETIKWGMPFFLLNGRPFANMAAFKAHAAFGFWRGVKAETGKESDAMGQFGRIGGLADLPDRDGLIALIRDAASRAETPPPKKPAKPAKPEAEIPADLAEALANDPAAAATFEAFPPSCRRDYCEWVGEAKRPETRTKRVAETIALLREGKRRHWKYENC